MAAKDNMNHYIMVTIILLFSIILLLIGSYNYYYIYNNAYTNLEKNTVLAQYCTISGFSFLIIFYIYLL